MPIRAQALRTAAVRLLLHNALRVDEACAADIADLGHRVLRVTRQGARKAKVPLTPATVAALDAYLADPAERAGVGEWRALGGPLLDTASCGRLHQGHLWELVRRLARAAGIGAWEQFSPHSLRHSAITFDEVSGVAAAASFSSRERLLPAAQRAGLWRAWHAGALCEGGDLGRYWPPAAGEAMMHLVP